MAIDRRPQEGERRFAPYAPGATVLKIIRHFRNREVPDQLTPTMLMQLNVTENLVPRVLRALQFIGLIGDTFDTTADFKRIPTADDQQYQQLLQGLLRTAYREIFQLVDVENAPRESLVRAFLPYAPASQRGRMVILFTELAREAGMRISGTEEEPRMTAPKIPIRKREPGRTPQGAGRQIPQTGEGAVHPSLLVLFADLPANGHPWTKADRDRWMKALQAMIDYIYPVREGEPEAEKVEA
ncbi:MAG: DUF5343 domain-containing protein [bacterium]